MSGNPFRLSPDEFLAFQEVLFIFLIIFSSIFLLKLPEGSLFQKITFIFMVVFIVFLVSFVLPNFILNDAVKARHKQLSRELPYTLDLLTISVEAGLEGFPL